VLRALDPWLYAGVAFCTLLGSDTLPVATLQAEGLVTGGVFVVGLCHIWLAMAERVAAAR
jgi:hypothetical protein